MQIMNAWPSGDVPTSYQIQIFEEKGIPMYKKWGCQMINTLNVYIKNYSLKSSTGSVVLEFTFE